MEWQVNPPYGTVRYRQDNTDNREDSAAKPSPAAHLACISYRWPVIGWPDLP